MYNSLFIQTALCIGSSKCLSLAAASLNQCPRDINILKYIHYHFGFAEFGNRKFLTRQHLNSLLPYLDRLGESEVEECAEVCQRLRIPEWSQKHLYSRLSQEKRKHYHPCDDDLLQELDELAAEENDLWRVKNWLEKFDKRHDSKSRVLTLVDCWLAFNPTVKGLRIAAACIQAVGTRKDLSILDQCTIEGSPDEIVRIKESTRFAVYRRSLD
jgi:hypothetical protein